MPVDDEERMEISYAIDSSIAPQQTQRAGYCAQLSSELAELSAQLTAVDLHFTMW